MHAIHAMQPHRAVAQTHHRGQEPRCRACVAHENLQRRLRCACIRDASSQPLHGDDAVAGLSSVRIYVNPETQRAQRIDHDLRILAP